MNKYNPGQKAPISGQFEIVGPRGGKTGIERTAIKGKTLPATPAPGQHYIPVDPSKNGWGKTSK